MEWQWHQLDHMQIICTWLQTDNHASTSSLNFFGDRTSNQQRQCTESKHTVYQKLSKPVNVCRSYSEAKFARLLRYGAVVYLVPAACGLYYAMISVGWQRC